MTDPCNVLFLMSDEQDGRVLGCAGHPLVRTPHLDRLAARGTRFANALTPSPICVPARASLATGQWVHRIGYWDNALAYDGAVHGWGHALIEAGHRVESIGKLHYVDDRAGTGFSRQINPVHLQDGIGQVWGSVRDPLPLVRGESPLYREIGAGESGYNRYDMANAAAAQRWLEQRAERPDPRPWLLFVGFVAPHFPLVVPQRFLDPYPPETIALPKLRPETGYVRHPWIERMARFMDHDAAIGTDARRRLAIACYLGLVSFVDEQVGRVLDALESTGLAETTLVCFTSDHGDNQGARGLWNKCTLYRESTEVPLILAGPDVPAARVSHTPVNLVDLAPTLMQAMGLDPACAPAGLPGRSLLEIAGAADDLRRLGFSEYHAVGSPSAAYLLRDARWAYHHYVGYRPELFDLATDPEQTDDLALVPGHDDLLAEFESRLRAMLDPQATDRRAKDAQNALVSRFGGRDRALGTGTPGATAVPETSSE